MSGAGKDTIANYFQDKHLYLKFRCAGTIKQIICEKSQLTFSQLESIKRTNENLRKEHWKVGDWMGKDGSAVSQRLVNIIRRDSVEFDIMPKSVKNNPIMVCDARRLFELEIMLANGFVGIFLSRTTDELKPNKHSTENNIFDSDELITLMKKYPGQCVLALNSDKARTSNLLEKFMPHAENALNIIMCPDIDGDGLTRVFSENLLNIIPEFFEGKSSEILLK